MAVTQGDAEGASAAEELPVGLWGSESLPRDLAHGLKRARLLRSPPLLKVARVVLVDTHHAHHHLLGLPPPSALPSVPRLLVLRSQGHLLFC